LQSVPARGFHEWFGEVVSFHRSNCHAASEADPFLRTGPSCFSSALFSVRFDKKLRFPSDRYLSFQGAKSLEATSVFRHVCMRVQGRHGAEPKEKF
jgi:hypothetical protein